MSIRILSIFFVFILLLGCDTKNPNSDRSMDKINNTISQLENNILISKKQIEDLKNDMQELKNDVYEKRGRDIVNEITHRVAMFTPSSKDFSTVNTDVGMFYIALKDIQKYANGYKLILSIGNPNSVTYNNLHVTVTYGKSMKGYDWVLDLLSSKKYEATILVDILPNYWNDISIILSPAQIEELEAFWVAINPSTVKLKIKESER